MLFLLKGGAHFSFNPLLSRNYQVHTRESGNAPPEEDPGTSSSYPSREIFPICYHRSCLFRKVCECPERERCLGLRIPLIYHLSSFHTAAQHFPYLDQVPSCHPLEKGIGASPSPDPKPQKMLGHLFPNVGTGPFLFGRVQIELQLPGFELTSFNSMTFRPIFFLFGLNLATSGPPPKASKLKIYPWRMVPGQCGKSNTRISASKPSSKPFFFFVLMTQEKCCYALTPSFCGRSVGLGMD